MNCPYSDRKLNTMGQCLPRMSQPEMASPGVLGVINDAVVNAVAIPLD